MGWDGAYDWTSITDVKNDIRASCARSNAKILGEAGSSEFWYVVEKEGVRYLCLSLIEKRGKSWMKKDMDEDVFPYHFKCPDKLLALVGPPKTEYAKNWREWRLAQIVKSTKKWEVGDKFLVFGDPNRVGVVFGPHGRGYIYYDENGRRWKIQTKDMSPMPTAEKVSESCSI